MLPATPPLATEIDRANECLWRGPERIDLTPKAFAVLLNLLEHRGQLVTKDQLFDAIWSGTAVTDGVLKVCVLELRRALGDDARAPRYIQTAHRRGYRFIGRLPERGAPRGLAEEAEELVAPLAGRERELARLGAELARTVAGERRTLFLAGPPGIGKSALIDAFLRRVAPDVRILRGHCLEHYGAGEAFLPVLEAFQRSAREDRQRESGALVPMLRKHAPSFLVQMASLIDHGERERLQREVLGATRERMLREIAEAIDTLSAERPVVLVLEDLHWSDHSSLDLVGWLARRRERARVLILLSYRPGDVIGSTHPFRALQHELLMHRLASELVLERLAVLDVVSYLGTRFGRHALPASLSEALHRRTEGHPLFLVNVVDWLQSQGALTTVDGCWRLQREPAAIEREVPAGLRRALELHLERLSEQDVRVLEAASVAGIDFSALAVAGALGEDPLPIEAVLESLVERHLFLRGAGVGTFPDGTVSARFAFLHSLYASVLHDRIPPARRIRLHQRIGERGEKLFGARSEEIAAELAVHFEASRDYPRAVHYLQLAAEVDSRRHANLEAEGHLLHARELGARLPGPERSRLDLALLERLGRTRRSRGDMRASAEAFEALIAAAGEFGDQRTQVRALLYHSSTVFWLDRERCLSSADRAVEIAGQVGDALLAAHARGYRGHAYMNLRGFAPEHVEECRRAIEAARVAGDAVLLSLHRVRFAYAELLQGAYDRALQQAEDGAELALAAGDGFDYLLARFFRAWALLYAGRFADLALTLDEGRQLAAKNGHVLWSQLLQLLDAQRSSQMLDFERARELARPVVRAARERPLESGQLLFHGLIALCEAELGLGDLQQAGHALAEIERALSHGAALMDWLLYLPLRHLRAECARLGGDTAGARVEGAALVAQAETSGEPTWRALGLLCLSSCARDERRPRAASEALSAALDLVGGGAAPVAAWRVHAEAARHTRGKARDAAKERELERALARLVSGSTAEEQAFLRRARSWEPAQPAARTRA